MFVMVAGRRQGKSTTAVRWLLEDPRARALLTSSDDRRAHLIRVAQNITRGHFDDSTFNRYVAERIFVAAPIRGFDLGIKYVATEVGIDDAEEVLRVLLGAAVGFVAFNATLIPVAGGGTINGDYIDVEQDAISGRKMIGRPIRDNPQA